MLILSLCKGRARWDKFERISIALCLVNSAIWILLLTFGFRAISDGWILVINIVNGTGLLRQVRRRPQSEDGTVWCFYCFADILNLRNVTAAAGFESSFTVLDAGLSSAVLALILLPSFIVRLADWLMLTVGDARAGFSAQAIELRLLMTYVSSFRFSTVGGHAALRYG